MKLYQCLTRGVLDRLRNGEEASYCNTSKWKGTLKHLALYYSKDARILDASVMSQPIITCGGWELFQPHVTNLRTEYIFLSWKKLRSIFFSHYTFPLLLSFYLRKTQLPWEGHCMVYECLIRYEETKMHKKETAINITHISEYLLYW